MAAGNAPCDMPSLAAKAEMSSKVSLPSGNPSGPPRSPPAWPLSQMQAPFIVWDSGRAGTKLMSSRKRRDFWIQRECATS